MQSKSKSQFTILQVFAKVKAYMFLEVWNVQTTQVQTMVDEERVASEKKSEKAQSSQEGMPRPCPVSKRKEKERIEEKKRNYTFLL